MSQLDSPSAPTQRNNSKQAQKARETRQRILQAAVQVFSEEGFAGARIDRISRAANSNDRMIYYYFGNKEQLFIAVLESVYQGFLDAEQQLQLNLDDPWQALEQIITFTFDYYLEHREFVAILGDENLHQAKHSRQSEHIQQISSGIQSQLARVVAAGQQQGLLRADIDISMLYLTISSLTYFYCSNQYTLSVFMNQDLNSDSFRQQWRANAIEVVRDTVKA
ncbi:TetR/AcrR family transcriptional regulator [Oceanobacter mangrovi]|uniref:TetR/AcrR family transcriptional regulator n=1 Tax=Oceanobacter mangrovi TaxID=2862510 RepID=UPI001C8D7A60|nr:TetR/AcrR family transcriptional regulator [Oceanobacter mangrovi]